MTTTRRQFLDALTMSATALGGLAAMPDPLSAMSAEFLPAHTAGEWDTTWPSRITGRVRAVFDVPEIESGYGVWRASLWARQYQQVLGYRPTELSTVLVLRHNAIVLAMQQEFWDRYGIGKARGVTHPVTGQPTDRNPALLGAADAIAALQVEFALGPFMQRGGVVLACNVALEDLVAMIRETDRIGEDEARAAARRWLVPGIIRQPSGIFAALLAQQRAKALYIRAS